eukprot:TRINITY_DN69153_c0_g1_i1.p2 TRINITY_DN69153_c0_g1~~TRINITY_DN69153_c0_g1_i1.p2  ORF type:complete len:162 (-),score=3.36 TRINITY_DN69153_c0_g1_i1:15-500(-)
MPTRFHFEPSDVNTSIAPTVVPEENEISLNESWIHKKIRWITVNPHELEGKTIKFAQRKGGSGMLKLDDGTTYRIYPRYGLLRGGGFAEKWSPCFDKKNGEKWCPCTVDKAALVKRPNGSTGVQMTVTTQSGEQRTFPWHSVWSGGSNSQKIKVLVQKRRF